MSRTGVIVALVIAAALAVATAVALRGGGKTAQPPQQFIGMSASELMSKVSGGSIEVVRTDSTDAVRPALWPDGWLMTSIVGQDSCLWSADPGRVRACVRVLAETAAQGDAPAPAGGLRVILRESGDSQKWFLKLTFGDSSLGGRTAVSVDTGNGVRSVYVPSEVAAMFAPESFRAWRETRVFSAAAGTFSRIGDGRILLSRVGSSWSLLPPVAEPADERAVAALLSGLEGLRFKELDLTPAAQWWARLEEAPPAILVETDLDPVTARRIGYDVAEQKLYIGGDGKAYCTTGLRSRAGNVAAFRGMASGLVDPAALKVLPKDAMTLVRKIASRRAGADVSAVRIGKAGATAAKREYIREADKWLGSGGQAVTQTDAGGIADLIAVACRTAAGRAVETAPEGATAVAAVQLTARDAPDDRWLTAYSAPGPKAPDGSAGRPVLVIGDGVVWRVYGAAELEKLGAWLRAAAE